MIKINQILKFICMMSLVLYSCKMLIKYISLKDEIYFKSEYTPKYFSCDKKEETQDIGLNYMKNNKVIICGLLRDKETLVPYIKKNTKNICNMFKDYRILLVENDSVDETRKLLIEWANEDNNVKILGCGINTAKCHLDLKKTIGHPTTIYRIEKMVQLRNIYMDYIDKNKNELEDFDYTIVWDFDLVGFLYKDGIIDTFYNFYNDKNISMIGANGIVNNVFKMRYYDTYAMRTNDNINFSKFENDTLWELYNFPLLCESSLKKVVSCFGGFVVYKTSKIIGKRYGTIIDMYGAPICEHVIFNKQIDNIYINPKMIYVILDNE